MISMVSMVSMVSRTFVTLLVLGIAVQIHHVATLGLFDPVKANDRVPSTLLLYDDVNAFDNRLLLVDQDGKVEQLSSADNDVRYLGIAAESGTGDVYFVSSLGAIKRARANSSESSSWGIETVYHGRVTVQVTGYNFGTGVGDIVSFFIRGVECSTVKRESSNSIACTTGHPILTEDKGKGITADDVIVETSIGGWTQGSFPGDFAEAKLADHSLQAIITSVETTSRDVRPHALAIHEYAGKIYFSDVASSSIERINIDDGAVEWDTFLPNVGPVYGIAIEETNTEGEAFLYFSNAKGGTISRIKLPSEGVDTRAEDRARLVEILVSGVQDPMGVALDPQGTRLFFTLYGGSIRAVARDGSRYPFDLKNVGGEGADYEVRRLPSGTRLDGIAVAPSKGSSQDQHLTEPRLYWTEFGYSPAIRRSSLDGTRVETLTLTTKDPRSSIPLVWPRSLVFGAGNSSGLLFCEHLGAVRRVSDPSVGVLETVVEADPYPASDVFHMLMRKASRRGTFDKYFTETSR